jgi:hypothetical protein
LDQKVPIDSHVAAYINRCANVFAIVEMAHTLRICHSRESTAYLHKSCGQSFKWDESVSQ